MSRHNIFRVQKNKDNPYVMLNKEFLNDTRLTAKAKGILAYLLSLPDDWKIYESEVATHFADGVKSINSGIKELIVYGYIIRNRLRDSKGKFIGYEYCVYEVSTETPKTENGKRHTTNNNITNMGKSKCKYQGHRKNGKLTDYQLKVTAEVARIEAAKKKMIDP